jgi:hypothetical protein
MIKENSEKKSTEKWSKKIVKKYRKMIEGSEKYRLKSLEK